MVKFNDNKTLSIFLIAGEASGDNLAAKLMAALKKQSAKQINFYGIGGPKMEAEGLVSLFPFEELSLMGFVEILPHLFKLLKRIKQTANTILDLNPEAVITVDSPGFSFRVMEQIKHSNVKKIHYVAPSVWAYKPKRAAKVARLYDHLLTLLPFENPYFEKEGLQCTYIGHPIVEDYQQHGESNFRQIHNLSEQDILLCMMPGSRLSEINRLLPIFLESCEILTQKIPSLKIALIAMPNLKARIEEIITTYPALHILLIDPSHKEEVFRSANIALIKSGTSSLEVAMWKVPMVVAYKVNKISALILKAMLKVKFVSLVNIINNQIVIPEFLQNTCKANLIADKLCELLNDQEAREWQIARSEQALIQLGLNSRPLPSDKAAQAVLEVINNKL
jgi:lipid-A-disaccharide synthase